VVSTLVETAEPKPERIAFRFRLHPGEPPAWHALRVRTREGISNPATFVVGVLPEKDEVEPNDLPADAKAISYPVTVKGRLGAEDRDTFRFTSRKGERLVFEVEARRLGSAVSPTMLLLRADGRELDLYEVAYGLEGDARIDHTFDADGEHFIQIRGLQIQGAGDSDRRPDSYRLRVGSFPYAEVVLPVATSSSPSRAVLSTSPSPHSCTSIRTHSSAGPT